ncbi:MAG: AMP-binding protein [Alysiella sp.]|uniref:AMP-binding protein n=1 Tax=Alysiella sp. TaxID=1872483 RepID=UPI0026DADBD1|nr:AMP-binding protein [Alysiella sp.]MDO4433396.1 AMP-binding protein [Alysiella sp.]
MALKRNNRLNLLNLWHSLDFSGSLKAQNIQIVALWFDDAAWFTCALLATWHAGARALLLPNLANENVNWAKTADMVLSDSADCVVQFSGSLDKGRVWQLPECLTALPDTQVEDFAIALSAQAVLKTSGSSGVAQIVVKTVAQMQAEALALAAVMPFGQQGASVIGSVSPQHMYGFTFRFALSLTMGWQIVRRQAVYPEDLLLEAASVEQAVWIVSPAVLNRMGEARNWQAVSGSLIGIVSAGGALPENTADLLEKHAVRPYEIYGSTETGVVAARQYDKCWQPFEQVLLQQDADGALAIQSPWIDDVWQSADVAEMQAEGFILLGRKDRIVKFEDKRVSLTQIEHELLRHEWLSDAHCGQHPKHQRIAVWLALNETGIVALRERGRAAVLAELKRFLADTQDAVALPRYWRLACALPRNAQAKIAAADFQAALTTPQTEPIWKEHKLPEKPDTWCFTGSVPLDLLYFSGHFAQFPLVPGVIELQWVLDLAARFAWGKRSIVRVENLKYQQFLRPNDVVSVLLQYDVEKDKLVFKLSNDEIIYASGRIVFA